VVRDGALALYVKRAAPLDNTNTSSSSSSSSSSANICGLSHEELREVHTFAARSLAKYMLPKHIVVVDSFPETANGKLDRKALPDPSDDNACALFLASETTNQTDNDSSPAMITTVTGPSSLSSAMRAIAARTSTATLSDVGIEHISQRSVQYPDAESGLIPSDHSQGQGHKDGSDSGTAPASAPALKGLGQGGKTRLHSRQVRAMTRLIIDTIERVRGRRPHPSASFAAIGMDSLGAVMFLRSLSDTVGGLKIPPAKVYAPGVTIASFAEQLLNRVEAETPDLLAKIGQLIIRSCV
jgi:Phosphopantetheine attachment site